MTNKLLITTLSFAGFFMVSASVSAATLSFSPTSGSPKVGDTGTLELKVDLGSDSSLGVEAYVTFNGSVIEVTDIAPSSKVSPVYVENFENIDNAGGKLQLSFVDAETPFTGSFTIATISYKAKASGTSKFDFVTGNNFGTSSVIDYATGGELLTNTVSSTLTVSSGSSSSNDDDDDDDDDSDSSSSSSSSSSGTTTSAVPETGTFDKTLFVVISGLIFAAGVTIKKIFV